MENPTLEREIDISTSNNTLDDEYSVGLLHSQSIKQWSRKRPNYSMAYISIELTLGLINLLYLGPLIGLVQSYVLHVQPRQLGSANLVIQ